VQVVRGESHDRLSRGEFFPLYTVLPCSGVIQWAHGGCGAKAPPLAARPVLLLMGRRKRVKYMTRLQIFRSFPRLVLL